MVRARARSRARARARARLGLRPEVMFSVIVRSHG